MSGQQFLQRLRVLAKQRGLHFRVEKSRGKGSHQTVWLGDRKTVIPDPRKEFKIGLRQAILKQLRVPKAHLEGD
jgi:mRNA interferase HicA